MKRGAEHHLFREDATSGRIHAWLREHHPKAGVCEECGRAGKTHYAFLHHPQRHTRNREDYRELCSGCHQRFDGNHAPRSHCRRGHELAGENVYEHNGRRWCRVCRLDARRRNYRRKKALSG